LFPNRSKIRHVADFLESTLGFADKDPPPDRDRPVYFGKQPVGERAMKRLLVTRGGHSKLWKCTSSRIICMDKRLTPIQKELWNRCDEVLHYVWDPIGVCTAPSARDEYSSYVPQVFALVDKDAPASKIADLLVDIENNRIGLGAGRKGALKVAELLLEYRKHINDRYTWQLTSDR
jgi:hypothetical protein